MTFLTGLSPNIPRDIRGLADVIDAQLRAITGPYRARRDRQRRRALAALKRS